jgi:thioesterase domain-containing protein
MTAPASPYTGKVLMEKGDPWHHGVSPSSHQVRLDSLLAALKNLVDAGLGAASVLVNLHHRRIVPLMERELRIREMSEATNPKSLARSRFLPDHLPQKYVATRARRAISLTAVRHSKRPGRAQKRLPPGGLSKRRRAPRRHWRASRKHPERCSIDGGHHHSACRALEEEEVGLLHLEVSSRSPRRPRP